jgi:hypothetical protein
VIVCRPVPNFLTKFWPKSMNTKRRKLYRMENRGRIRLKSWYRKKMKTLWEIILTRRILVRMNLRSSERVGIEFYPGLVRSRKTSCRRPKNTGRMLRKI